MNPHSALARKNPSPAQTPNREASADSIRERLAPGGGMYDVRAALASSSMSVIGLLWLGVMPLHVLFDSPTNDLRGIEAKRLPDALEALHEALRQPKVDLAGELV